MENIQPLFLREILEQPRVLANTLAQYVGPGYNLKMTRAPLDNATLKKIQKVYLTGCGTSFHAAMTARYLLEELAEIPTVVEPASECGQHQLLVDNNTLAVSVSQSGRSKETITALELAKKKGAITLALVNEAKSPLAKSAQGYITTLAGRVLTPSSTKAFTSQTLVLGLLAFRIAQVRGLLKDSFREEIQQFERVAETVRHALSLCQEQIPVVSAKLLNYAHLFILAKGHLLPMVYEGALKLKEVAKFHAEGYSAGEFGHGPLALASPSTPVILMAFSDRHNGELSYQDLTYELKKRGAPLILITEDGPRKNVALLKLADCAILLPPVPPRLLPLVALSPLQLLACRLGILKGEDVDHPGGNLFGGGMEILSTPERSSGDALALKPGKKEEPKGPQVNLSNLHPPAGKLLS
ncbi:MAG: SIS domain-containing protein [Deltaproteobacteria bacterium]|jgi:glucosamine--fructose-6-phosphate aminotransferase (isomerizing)|nr:SIS domain-containing protein [Deltaproteobacteria bacterium]